MNPLTTRVTHRTRLNTNWSIRSASITAGVGLLLMSALAGFGTFVAVEGLVTQGNAAQTAEDIVASEGLFRLGIASLFLVIALDVAVAWALYRVFSPVSKAISLLAAWFRVVYAGVFMVAISQLVGVLRLLGGDHYLAAFGADQLHTQALLRINAFHSMWDAGMFLFGLHLIVIGYLAYRSGYVPRLLGVLLAVAGMGYLVDSLTPLLLPGIWSDVTSVTFIGEFLLALWLVIRGRRLTLNEAELHQDPITAAR
ncbi:MAG: DUF4386 domain-containing protein [Nocardioidaceae bacterium]